MRIAHARVLSNTTHCPRVNSKSVCMSCDNACEKIGAFTMGFEF